VVVDAMTLSIATLRLNLGCGEYPLTGFVNVDAEPYAGVDLVAQVPPLPWPDDSATEIWAGHFLEHLDRGRGAELLAEAYRILVPGGTLGVVVPDFREVARRYVQGEDAPFLWVDGMHDMRNLDELCHFVLFSDCQTSHHQWAYDLASLKRALERAGFIATREIDRFSDPRLSTPRWYQCGWEAVKQP
jgi:predicted SAM-dependent methyltransferase